MGLTALDIGDVARLAQLAANPQDATREEIYIAVASLYRVEDGRLNPRERKLINDILRQLTIDVEMSIRIALAQKLSEDPAAPYDLILMLADDRIEVARPVILCSPLLTERDMLHLALECSEAHQEALAARPHIGHKVTAALADCEHVSVLTTLVRNATARIAPEVIAALVEKSRQIEALQEPLSRREDMPPEIGVKMCTFVSETLKSFIVRNYAIQVEKLQTALKEANDAVRHPQAPQDAGDNAARLIDKLYTAGQLKAGFLMRVLQQNNIDLFELGFARLLEAPLSQTRQILYEQGPQTVALACRAVGIDRCVFPLVYTLSRKIRALPNTLAADDLVRIDEAFSQFSKTTALRRLHDN